MNAEWNEGDVIRKLRLSAAWKLKHLAAASGVSLQVIHRIEIGETKAPEQKTINKIAKAFGWTRRQLEDAIPSQPITLTQTVIAAHKAREAEREAERLTKSKRRHSSVRKQNR